MKEMVEDYTAQLEVRDLALRRLETQDFANRTEVQMMMQRENEALK